MINTTRKTSTKRKRIGDLLVEANMISETQLKQAIQKQKGTGKKVGEVLVDEGWVTEDQIIQVLEFQLGIPHIDLGIINLDRQIARLVSESLAKRYTLIPVKKIGNSLQVAMSDPLNIYAIDDVRRITKLDVVPLIATTSDINRAINRIYGEDKTREMVDLFQDQTIGTDLDIEKDDEILYDVANSPIVKFVDNIFDQAIARGASDIHIEPSEHDVRVRLRIDGHLTELLRADKSTIKAITARIKILARLDIAERRLPQDGRINMNRDNQEIDLRVSILPTIHGEKTVIRLLYRTGMRLTIDQLGLHPVDNPKFRDMLKMPNGIILVTGPTGSGKSTTLATALREINQPDINIITVEDPVENVIEGVNQVAVNVKANLTFANALRSILRQDPDVIMIGEMRDSETSDIAIRSAITGHLVISTLHTNDATSSITRLIDMGAESYMIGSSVRGIVAQRLVRKLCKNCREEDTITEEEYNLTKIPVGTKVYKAKGCHACSGTGYKGRFGVHEVFVVDLYMQDIISKNEHTSEELREEAIKRGMRTLQDNARWRVLSGDTTVEEMLQITYAM
ncbi:MAG: Flp pilus assembly complex ATPase component TadA [Epulopiscium sp.]|nr:Flp pilus assembly complex ATPase component TadA [Candidatus Epulonipiscium sp.]